MIYPLIMNIILDKKIDDVTIIDYKSFKDDRGHFSEVYVSHLISKIIPDFAIKQINFSRSMKNVARGLHLQITPPMGKLMRVINGSATLFAFDCRKNNQIEKKIIELKLNSNSNKLVWAPHYYARGFISHEDNTLIEYFCTETYNAQGEYAINLLDDSLNLQYEINNLLLSEKDKSAMGISDWFSFGPNL